MIRYKKFWGVEKRTSKKRKGERGNLVIDKRTGTALRSSKMGWGRDEQERRVRIRETGINNARLAGTGLKIEQYEKQNANTSKSKSRSKCRTRFDRRKALQHGLWFDMNSVAIIQLLKSRYRH